MHKYLLSLLTLCLLVLCTFSTVSCSDSVDDSNLYSFQGETVSSYLEKNPQYSLYNYILHHVKLSNKASSTLADLLSTRGNYTCFAPTNESLQAYLDSIYDTPNFQIENITDSVAQDIARNSLIDNGDNAAYTTADFLEGSLPTTNMNDRYITVKFDTRDGRAIIILNSDAYITVPDIEVENGEIHEVSKPLMQSNAYLPNIIEQTPNMQIFALLLQRTGWADSMMIYRDEHYEETKPTEGYNEHGNAAVVPAHRYFGFTAFIEPDEVYQEKWGISAPVVENGRLRNADEIWEQINAKCRELNATAQSDDPTSTDNAVNQFVSYHILPMRITYDKLVIHYAEIGYSYRNPTQLSINCHEYYETIDKHNRRLMKFTEGASTAGIRINRWSKYDPDTYDETTVMRQGTLVSPNNGDYGFNALNGFYYPIDDILTYDEGVPNQVLNERIRFDISSILPELMTNGFRRMQSNQAIYFPAGYFDNIDYDEDANYDYLPSYGLGYPDYQGDEHNIQGQYDLIVKLPPVPYKGTWELRWSVPIFTNRGMAQLYLGSDKNNLPAIGLPLDLRLYANNPTIGWVADGDDKQANIENDKVMRNHGYMKPPKHDGATTGGVVSRSLRDETAYQRLRKIIYTANIGPNDVLYLRIKSVLSNTSTMFVMDWMEWAPKTVYAGDEVEDMW